MRGLGGDESPQPHRALLIPGLRGKAPDRLIEARTFMLRRAFFGTMGGMITAN